MRAIYLIGLVVLAFPGAALAGDCQYWNRLPPAARAADIENMITAHMTSNNSKKYTSVDKVAIRRCLRDFVPRIVEEVDQACTDRPGGNAEYVDDIFDKFLLSCV
jgi:hypothetical protein